MPHYVAMPFRLREVVSFLDETLEISRFKDYGTNGLQVEGAAEVDTVVTGVSASLALLERANELSADLVVVHHGLFWGGGLRSITGAMTPRIKALLANDMSLAAYHLPLDKHARLGNNVGIADAIGLAAARDAFGDVRGVALGLAGSWPQPLTRDEAIARVANGVCDGTTPRFVFAHGPAVVRRVGICSGAASDLLESAAASGCDLFITGELAERAADIARELQITLVAAGHYATEVFGAMRLAEELRVRFAGINAQFVAMPNPL
jgi:dinuclear metal center YbgI/SA1388 family protein